MGPFSPETNQFTFETVLLEVKSFDRFRWSNTFLTLRAGQANTFRKVTEARLRLKPTTFNGHEGQDIDYFEQ